MESMESRAVWHRHGSPLLWMVRATGLLAILAGIGSVLRHKPFAEQDVLKGWAPWRAAFLAGLQSGRRVAASLGVLAWHPFRVGAA